MILSNGRTSHLKGLEQKFTALAKEFQVKASTMSEVGRAREQKDLAKMEREYKGKLQESEEDMKISMQMGQERLFREHNQAVQPILSGLLNQSCV